MKKRMNRIVVWVAVLVSCTSVKDPKEIPKERKRVRAEVVRSSETEIVIEAFGTISFEKKIDVQAGVEGIIVKKTIKEGDKVRKGTVIGKAENLQLGIAFRRALSARDQAKTALALSEAKLTEGELAIESRFAAIEKAEIEVVRAKRKVEETERKLADQELLLDAGGAAKESIRILRMQVEDEKADCLIAIRDLELRRIGFRTDDLKAYGYGTGGSDKELRIAYVRLNTISLRAERDVQAERLKSAEAEVESASLVLGELIFRAPQDGIIGAVYVEEGEHIKAGDKYCTFMETERVFAVFPVRENDAQSVSRGDRALITLDGVNGKSYEAVVDIVSPAADPSVGAFTVKAILANPDGSAKPGMFARVAVHTGNKTSAIWVASGSLTERNDGEATVQVVQDGAVSRRKVVTGASKDGMTVIRTGLSEGDITLVEPDPSLGNGEAVTVDK